MAYAPSTRPFYDADSHVMELPNFLRDLPTPPFARRSCRSTTTPLS